MKCCRGEVVVVIRGGGGERRRREAVSDDVRRQGTALASPQHKRGSQGQGTRTRPQNGQEAGSHIPARMSKYTRPRAQVTRSHVEIRRLSPSRSRTDTGHRSSREARRILPTRYRSFRVFSKFSPHTSRCPVCLSQTLVPHLSLTYSEPIC